MYSYFNSYYRHLVSQGRERQPVGGFLLQTLAILFILMALMVVTRAAGNLDPAFHVDGKVVQAIGAGTDRGYAMVVQLNGKIIVAGANFKIAKTIERKNFHHRAHRAHRVARLGHNQIWLILFPATKPKMSATRQSFGSLFHRGHRESVVFGH